MALENLEPKNVFRFFEELSGIPRESGNMAAVSGWVADFAAKRGLRCRQDRIGNVVIWKGASSGYEGRPAVMLQGHLDMVCVKSPGVNHDFAAGPLKLHIIDGDWLAARGTSLGGDDGIAVAMMMALLDDDSLPHPPVEAVFTVDEEIGLLGAAGLDCSELKSRLLINLDSEDEDVLTVGCAGGARCDLRRTFPTEPVSGKVCTISVTGLPGGHSGAEIHKNIPNANRTMAQILDALPGFRLVSLHGGEQDNAIPDRAKAVAILPEGADERAEEAFRAAAGGQGRLTLDYADSGASVKALSAGDSRKAAELILSAPNGVQAMEPDLPGQVRTSLNLGILRLEEGELRLTWSVRSSAAPEKEALVPRLKALADAAGASFSRRGDYPAWEYRKNSRLRDTMVRVFREKRGKDPVVVTIHAGLECGLLAEKLPGLDAVSIGPNLRDIHSPRERMSISSVQRTWDYLLAVLSQL